MAWATSRHDGHSDGQTARIGLNKDRMAVTTEGRSMGDKTPVRDANRASTAAILVVRMQQGCNRPPAIRSDTGTSNGHGPADALVIIASQSIENAA